VARDKSKMRVLDIAEQKFRTGIEHDRAHTSTIEARTLNVEPVAIALRGDVDCLFAEKPTCVARRCAQLSSGLVLFLANQGELSAFDDGAIDRHFGDVFAARDLVHDVQHDSFEH